MGFNMVTVKVLFELFKIKPR